MSERRSAADLGSPAEAALHAFPFPERDWEASARAVEARLSDAERGSTDALLLAAPLPKEPGEPVTWSATTTPLTHSGVRTQSLAEMARRSVEQKRAAERELLRASLALTAPSRPSGAPIPAERELASAVRAAPAPTAPPSANPTPAQRAHQLAPGSRANSAWPLVALGAGGLALAAALLLWLRTPTPAPLASSVATLEPAHTPPESPTSLAPAPGGTIDHAAAAASPVGARAVIDPSTLSQESPAPAGASKRALATSAVPSTPAPAGNASAGPSPEKVVLEDVRPGTASAAAEKPEHALPADPALRPADSTGGAIPMKPSTGAVQAALGAVMSGARHCVAGDEIASSAVVVFGSDGRVQSVTVRGPAAGKPSGACIEGQLSRARVQPFAAQSFSISATVRPD